MEYLDVLDDKGNPTGAQKTMAEIHRDGDWHRAAHVWIVNFEGELLLQKRPATADTHPGEWDVSSAGHTLAGENQSTSAIRETKEELGIDIAEEELEYLFTVVEQKILKKGTYISNEFNDVYL